MKKYSLENALYKKQESDIILIGLPFYKTSTKIKYSSPNIIRETMNLWSSYNMDTGKNFFDTLKICDLGNINANNYDELKIKVNKALSNIPRKSCVCTIGGEHLVSLPVIQAINKNKEIGVLEFDAHLDAFDTYAGQKYSYATINRRLIEVLGKERLVLAGVRDVCEEELSAGIKITSFNKVINAMKKTGLKSWYINIDFDVLNPLYGDSVSTPVPGGLSINDIIKVINRSCLKFDIAGFDVVEVNSKTRDLTAIHAASLFWEFMKTKRREVK